MNKRNFLITAALSAAFCFFGTANAAETLKIGASPVPHADILKVVQPELAKKGIDLKIIEFSDYIQPNLALSDKDLDANFFQHLPCLDAFSKDHRLNLVSAGAVHIEPMGVYSKKVKNLADLKKAPPSPFRMTRRTAEEHFGSGCCRFDQNERRCRCERNSSGYHR